SSDLVPKLRRHRRGVGLVRERFLEGWFLQPLDAEVDRVEVDGNEADGNEVDGRQIHEDHEVVEVGELDVEGQVQWFDVGVVLESQQIRRYEVGRGEVGKLVEVEWFDVGHVAERFGEVHAQVGVGPPPTAPGTAGRSGDDDGRVTRADTQGVSGEVPRTGGGTKDS